MLTRRAYAKINLYLRIVGRREDGLHEIETLFQRLEWGDTLGFEGRDGEGVELECSGGESEGLSTGAENLVSKAWRAMKAGGAGAALPRGIRVELEKRIPLGGGLGGGSSDAAATLTALNELSGGRVAAGELGEIARGLGADVPFFLGAPAAVGRGVGEELTAVDHASRFFAVLAMPEFGVSTAAVYGMWNAESAPADAPRIETVVDALTRGDLGGTLASLYNEMEGLAESVEARLGPLRERLEDIACRPVRLSGSGSTLFTLVGDPGKGEALCDLWRTDCGVSARVAPFHVE